MVRLSGIYTPSTQPWPGPAGCLPATRAECLDGAGEGESGRAAAASLGAGWQWMGLGGWMGCFTHH